MLLDRLPQDRIARPLLRCSRDTTGDAKALQPFRSQISPTRDRQSLGRPWRATRDIRDVLAKILKRAAEPLRPSMVAPNFVPPEPCPKVRRGNSVAGEAPS